MRLEMGRGGGGLDPGPPIPPPDDDDDDGNPLLPVGLIRDGVGVGGMGGVVERLRRGVEDLPMAVR